MAYKCYLKLHAGIVTKDLRNAICALYESRGLDPNTYVEDNEEEQQLEDSESTLEEPELDRQQPFEYEGEKSILPLGSPCARLMPIPKSLQCAKKLP